MCFTFDPEWFASIVEVDDSAASDKPARCGECCRMIPAGEPHRHVFQQENEDCGEGDAEGFDPGETFDYDCCGECVKLLRAVEASELEAGCHKNEAVPPYEMLFEHVHESGCGKRYAGRALAMFPELAGSPQLAKLLSDDDEEAAP
jgi:hypothetical protein